MKTFASRLEEQQEALSTEITSQLATCEYTETTAAALSMPSDRANNDIEIEKRDIPALWICKTRNQTLVK